MKLPVACLLSLLLAPVMGAAATPELVQAVLDNAVPGAEQRCSYSRTRIDAEHSRRERYRPEGGNYPWSLEVVDGRAPTADELREYADGQSERERRHPLAFELRSMAAADAWSLRSETATEAIFTFRLRPNEDLDAHLADKVAGTLVVDRTRRQPLRVSIVNTEPAYVAPLVRIATYSQDLTFRWDEALGMSVLAERETSVRGRALGLKVISKHDIVRYGDYRCTPVDAASFQTTHCPVGMGRMPSGRCAKNRSNALVAPGQVAKP